MKNLQKLYFLYIKETGKVFYIGITCQHLNKRKRQHIIESKSQNYLVSQKIKSILRKNQTIEIELLLKSDKRNEICDLEKKYIEWCKKIGINLKNTTSGGDNLYEYPDYVRKKISDQKLGVLNPMYGMTGSLNHFYGKSHSKESNQENQKNHFCKSVLLIEKNRIFPSLSNAQKETGIHKSSIKRCCDLKSKKAGGFSWRYTND